MEHLLQQELLMKLISLTLLVVILDIVDQAETERAVELCRSLRQGGQAVRILLLVRPERAVVRTVAVETKNAGLADDFVFYDSSLSYLLAKLAAF